MPFYANTFEEVEEQSKMHGIQILKTGDKEHLEAINKMQEPLQTPDAMQNGSKIKKKRNLKHSLSAYNNSYTI